MAQAATAPLLRLLGDETRLRLLRLLHAGAAERLGADGHSRASRSPAFHAIWASCRTPASSSSAAAALSPGTSFPSTPRRRTAGRRRLWAWLRAEFARPSAGPRAPTTPGSQEVRRLRHENFAQHGGGDERRQLVPGRSWAAWARALGLLLPPLDVADLGCGEGYLTIETARWARKVIAVDRSKDVLDRAREPWRRGAR